MFTMHFIFYQKGLFLGARHHFCQWQGIDYYKAVTFLMKESYTASIFYYKQLDLMSSIALPCTQVHNVYKESLGQSCVEYLIPR